jgi:hypothetical protein
MLGFSRLSRSIQKATFYRNDSHMHKWCASTPWRIRFVNQITECKKTDVRFAATEVKPEADDRAVVPRSRIAAWPVRAKSSAQRNSISRRQRCFRATQNTH